MVLSSWRALSQGSRSSARLIEEVPTGLSESSSRLAEKVPSGSSKRFAGSSEISGRIIKKFRPSRQKVLSESSKSSDRLDGKFSPNRRRVPAASPKGSVRVVKEFRLRLQKSSELSNTSGLAKSSGRIIKKFWFKGSGLSKVSAGLYRGSSSKGSGLSKIPVGLSRGSGSKVPDYQKFRPDYQETPVPKIPVQKIPARLCGDLRHYKTQNQSTLLSKQKQHYALSGASVRQKIPGAIVSMYFISTC